MEHFDRVSVYTKIVLCILAILCIVSALSFHFVHTEEGAPEKSNVEKTYVSAVIVPHHDLVAAQRAQFFSDLSQRITAPKTIILISPNHYSAGRDDIQTTEQTWMLGEGTITANQEIISDLEKHTLASSEPASFVDEHGIYNILADIHHTFPEASLVPIIFKSTASRKRTDAVEKRLLKTCADCLVIASVDFSHYQPALLGELHDDVSIRSLEALDSDALATKAEVDSGPSLAFTAVWAQDHATLHFVLRNHTSSDILESNPDGEGTTHIFGWYEKGDSIVPERSVSFFIGGDMMFARGINQKFGTDFDTAFSQFGDRVFWGTDASVVNLEGAISEIPRMLPFDTMQFVFSPTIVKALSFLHVNGASSANNHSDNAGSEGIATTRAVTGVAGIQSFGGPKDADVSRVAVFEGNGLTLKIIGVNMTYPGQDGTSVIPVIRDLKKDPTVRVMVMPHWGVEYATGHTPAQENAAHAWIDAGADLVVGSHPHVIEDAELYKQTPIIYSMGNLLFDQTFSLATQQGLLIAGKFTDTGITFFGLPVQSNHYSPELMVGAKKKEILDRLYVPFSEYLTDTPAGEVVEVKK